MTTYYLNGNPSTEGADITINGFTYPYSWLEGTSPSVRASLGIEKQGDINYDERYYTGVGVARPLEDREEVDEEGNPVFVKVCDPEEGREPGAMVDTDRRLVTKGMKTIWIANIKKQTNDLLKPTDSKVMDETITTEESEYRADVITESDRLDTALQAATDLDTLINIVNSQNWPKNPEDLV